MNFFLKINETLFFTAPAVSSPPSLGLYSPESALSPGLERRRHLGHADAASAAVRRVVLHQSQHQIRQVHQVPCRTNPGVHGAPAQTRGSCGPV